MPSCRRSSSEVNLRCNWLRAARTEEHLRYRITTGAQSLLPVSPSGIRRSLSVTTVTGGLHACVLRFTGNRWASPFLAGEQQAKFGKINAMEPCVLIARRVKGSFRTLQGGEEPAFATRCGDAPESEPLMLHQVMRLLGRNLMLTQAERQRFQEALTEFDSAEIVWPRGPKFSSSVLYS
jgi:hypothetical protein